MGQEAVMTLLEQLGPMSAQDIAKRLDLSPKSVLRSLQGLRNGKEVYSVECKSARPGRYVIWGAK